MIADRTIAFITLVLVHTLGFHHPRSIDVVVRWPATYLNLGLYSVHKLIPIEGPMRWGAGVKATCLIIRRTSKSMLLIRRKTMLSHYHFYF